MISAKVGMLFDEHDKSPVIEMCKHLKGMCREHLIELVGAPTGEVRIEQDDLSSLDIVLLLISSDFINNDFLVEMALWVDRMHNEMQRIIPIVLKPINLERDLPRIGVKQGLPRNGKPVSLQNRDEALSKIANEIRHVANELLQRVP